MSETVYYKSPLGWLRIDSDEVAINSVKFIDRQAETSLPVDTCIIPLTSISKRCFMQFDEYFEGKRKSFDLALSQPGTTFQQEVWNGLLDINYVKTLSYLAFSKSLEIQKLSAQSELLMGKIILPSSFHATG